MGRYDADQSAGFCYAMQFADERHDIRDVLDHMAANDLIKFVISERIRQHAEIVNDVCVGARV